MHRQRCLFAPSRRHVPTKIRMRGSNHSISRCLDANYPSAIAEGNQNDCHTIKRLRSVRLVFLVQEKAPSLLPVLVLSEENDV